MQLDESKSAAEHLSLFTCTLSQLQDSGFPPFDDKLKAILLMTLPDSWETLVVSLSNNPNLTFDGVRGSILNEEIRRKASGEGGSSANMVRGRTEKKNAYAQRSKSKSKERGNASKGKEIRHPEACTMTGFDLKFCSAIFNATSTGDFPTTSSLSGQPSTAFCNALEGSQLLYPVTCFGLQWAKEAHPLDWESKHYVGKIVAFNSRKKLFKCIFEGDETVYMLSWDSLRMYIVREEETVVDAPILNAFDADDLCLADFLACKKREIHASRSLNVLQDGGNFVTLDVDARDLVIIHADARNFVALTVDARNSVAMQEGTFGFSCQASVANMSVFGVHAAPPMLGKRGLPPKRTVLGRGQPKVCVAQENLDCNGKNVDVAMHDAHVGAKIRHARAHACGKGYKQAKKRGKVQKPTVKKFYRPDTHRSDDSGDEHASVVGVEDDCEDEILEAEGQF
ncbi:hypothetical protein L7F22_047499 [Adiantum nelumboides]|nr:hypothetical protein [Adiantum nelumboides]